jgi:hypothetical protein
MKDFLVLNEDIAVDIGPESKNWDSGYQDWFYIQNGFWFISHNTIWDGATLVPDGPEDPNKKGYPILWLASLIHDLGYMSYMDDEGFPYSRKEIDKIFKRLMKEANFKPYSIYYRGVRWFGGVWNSAFSWYRKTFNKPRTLPNNLYEYTPKELSIIQID